jgi:hypothetical protein
MSAGCSMMLLLLLLLLLPTSASAHHVSSRGWHPSLQESITPPISKGREDPA